MASSKNELQSTLIAALNGASLQGINPADGTSRAVAVYSEVTPNAPFPYVRLTITDSSNLEDEPFDYTFVPTAVKIMFTINAFSDNMPERDSLADQVRTLFQHREITTDTYHGNTWFNSDKLYEDNITDPDRVEYLSSARFQARLEPIS